MSARPLEPISSDSLWSAPLQSTSVRPILRSRSIGTASQAARSPDPRSGEHHQNPCKRFASVSPGQSGHYLPSLRAPMLDGQPLTDMVSSKQTRTARLWIRRVLVRSQEGQLRGPLRLRCGPSRCLPPYALCETGLLVPIMLIAVLRLTSRCSRIIRRVAKPEMTRGALRFRNAASSSVAALWAIAPRRAETRPRSRRPSYGIRSQSRPG